MAASAGATDTRLPATTSTPPRLPASVMGLGVGGFNLVVGLIDHQLRGIHHVRDDLDAPLEWDLAFLASGLLLIAGVAPARSGERIARARGSRPR